MYKIKKSNGIYYLLHGKTRVMANTDFGEFCRKVILKIQPTLSTAEKIYYAVSVGDFTTATELVNL